MYKYYFKSHPIKKLLRPLILVMIPLGAVGYLENVAACQSKFLTACELKRCVAKISQEIIYIADNFHFRLTNNLLPRYNCCCGDSISLHLG